MKKYVVANQKGGVGKTTVAINLAGGLSATGKRVLIVDMDAQANSTYSLLETRTPVPSVYDLMVDQEGNITLPDTVVKTRITGIDVLPSNRQSMRGAERELAGIIGEQVLLSNRLRDLDSQYDYVIIDAPPSLGVLTINAITAADEVIIPVAPGVFAMQGIEDLFELIRLIQERLDRPNLKVAGFLLNLSEGTNVSKDISNDLRKYFSDAVFMTQIPKNVSLEEAHSRGGSIFQHAPNSKGAQAFTRLVEEILTNEQY